MTQLDQTEFRAVRRELPAPARFDRRSGETAEADRAAETHPRDVTDDGLSLMRWADDGGRNVD